MPVRQVTPADGSTGVTIGWDLGTVFLQSGTVLDVPPGSALESTIGLANLTLLSVPELDSCQQGSAGAVSN
jgi:hypothetical protein